MLPKLPVITDDTPVTLRNVSNPQGAEDVLTTVRDAPGIIHAWYRHSFERDPFMESEAAAAISTLTRPHRLGGTRYLGGSDYLGLVFSVHP